MTDHPTEALNYQCSCGEHKNQKPHACPVAKNLYGNDDKHYCECCHTCEMSCFARAQVAMRRQSMHSRRATA